MKFVLLLFLSICLISCEKDQNPIIKGEAVQAGMPSGAANVDEYKIRLLRTIDTTVTPMVTFSKSDDTLSFCFDYKQQGDGLPEGDLPHDLLYEKTFKNTDDLWGPDNEAKLKFWISLEPGLWQATVTASNRAGSTVSGRYDFLITDSIGLMVDLQNPHH